MKISLPILTILVLFLPAVTGQFVVDADCTACSKNCRWWDLVCGSYKWFCNVVAGFSDTLINNISAACADDPIAFEGRDMIVAANQLLVSRGIYKQEDLDGVEVRFCSSLNGLGGLELLGFTPSANLIWLDESWMTADSADFAILMAHEYVHIKQWREYDDKFIKCEYAEKTLSGVSSTDIWIEVEAYDFQNSVTNCIREGIDCPEP